MNPRVAYRLYLGLQLLRGEPVGEALTDVRRTERFSADQLRALQFRRQREQLLFAARYVPYYRQLLEPHHEHIRSIEEPDQLEDLLRQLPALERETVQQRQDDLTARDIGPLPCHPDRTSGSTGTPLVFPCDQRAWAYRHALTWRAMEAYGIHPGEPYAYFVGSAWSRWNNAKLKLRDWVFNRRRISAFEIGRDSLERHWCTLRRHRPRYLLGYPSALYEFSLLCREHGFDLQELPLRAVFLSSEPVYAYQRDAIREATGVPCCNLYGSAEGGLNAYECPAGRLHLTVEATSFDLRPSQNGQDSEGRREILVTDLMLRTMPLIRYAIGDEVTSVPASLWQQPPCDCGRGHPWIEPVAGRRSETLHLPNGRRLNGNVVNYLFKSFAPLGSVRRCRFVETADQRLQLWLAVTDAFTEAQERHVEHETRQAMGPDLPLDLHVVDRLPALPSAKHRDYIPYPPPGEEA